MAAVISGKFLIHNGLLPVNAVRGSAASKPEVQNRGLPRYRYITVRGAGSG